MTAIVNAAATWNSFYGASLGMQALDYGSASSPNTSNNPKPTSVCSASIVKDGAFSGQVVIYKTTNWPYSSEAIALTSFCPSPASPLPLMYQAIMEVNYKNFFISGKRQPDLQTIVLHEFGHLMGLSHSCESSAKTGIPNCNDASLNPDYFTALMYPSFGFDSAGTGEQKRNLRSNDQGRANCLYKTQ
jgi:hypothetical protein